MLGGLTVPLLQAIKAFDPGLILEFAVWGLVLAGGILLLVRSGEVA